MSLETPDGELQLSTVESITGTTELSTVEQITGTAATVDTSLPSDGFLAGMELSTVESITGTASVDDDSSLLLNEESLLREDSKDESALAEDGEDEFSTDDPEIEAIKARVREMEEEAEKLKEMQKAAEDTLLMGSPPSHHAAAAMMASPEEKTDIDNRSVFVGNVDYAATATDLEQHFHGCGGVNRVTILCDKFSGNPKGFAYVEFTDKDSVEVACQLNDSLFKGRQIKVTAKRTNIPGLSSTNRFPRSRGRGRGRGFYGGGGYGGGYNPRFRGRGSFRSRRAQWYSPY